MSGTERGLRPRLLVDNSHRFNVLPEGLLERTGGLYFEHDCPCYTLSDDCECGSNFFIVHRRGSICRDSGQASCVKAVIGRQRLLGKIQACRHVWTREVLNWEQGERQPFRTMFDLKPVLTPQGFREIGARLALAGRDLFRFLFFEGNRNPELQAIGRCIEERSREVEMVLEMTSNKLSVPWPMLYTHLDPEGLKEDGSNFTWDGFWGYRHVLQHEIEERPCDPAQSQPFRLVPVESGKIVASINADERIDEYSGIPYVRRQVEFFQGLDGLVCTIRRFRGELEHAVRSRLMAEVIVYILSHHRGAGDLWDPNLHPPSFTLSDNDPITVHDVQSWFNGRDFSTRPFVFFIGCESGHLETLFHVRTIPYEFLRRGALGLIGAQIEVPLDFADEYAQRFFRALIPQNGAEPKRVGIIVRDLARQFIEEDRNPLGLVMSLYRGLDCFVDLDRRTA